MEINPTGLLFGDGLGTGLPRYDLFTTKRIG